MLFSAMDTQQIVLIVLVVLLVIVLIVMPIFTNKKRQQSVNTLHNSLKVGDKVMTIGGIIGIVTEVKQTSPVDKEFTIETGEEGRKTTMVLDIKALYQIMPEVGASAAVQTESKPAESVASANVTDVFEETAPAEAPVEPEVKEEKTEEVAEVKEEPASEPEKAEEAKPAPKPRTSTRKPVSKK